MGRPTDWKLKSSLNPTLLGRIVLTFLVLGCVFAFLLRSNPVIFVTCSLLATVLLSIPLSASATARLRIARQHAPRVVAGAPFWVRLLVKNESRWRPAFDVGFLDALQVTEKGAVTRGAALPVLPPEGRAQVTYEKRMHRRGIYSFGSARVATRFPLGLFERRVLLPCRSRLVVIPALGRLGERARRELTARPQERSRARRFGGGDEFHSMREYRPGDNPRHIHWRTSARTQSLVRRVLHQEQTEDVTIVLDTYLGGAQAEVRARHFERAISCAATLLAEARRHGRRAVLVAPGMPPHPCHGPAALTGALEALAGIEAGRVTPDVFVDGLSHGGGSAILLSLSGSAPSARRQAAARGIPLSVWDVAHPTFAAYFQRT